MDLHDLSGGFEKFPQKLINVRYEESASNPLENKAVKDSVTEAEGSLGKSGRVLLRKSGTEPLIRVMVESDDEMQSLKWAEFIADAVRKVAN